MQTKKVFVDTNIFMDYYLDRKDSLIPLGEFAFRFIKETIRCKYFILIPQPALGELKRALKMTEEDLWQKILSELKEANKIQLIDFSNKQYFEAKKLSEQKKIPLADTLIGIMARDNNVPLISRDKHFEELIEEVNVLKPEELD